VALDKAIQSIRRNPGLSPAQSSTVWKGAGGAIGTISVPLGHSFGGQVDLGSGAFGNRPFGDATGHLFWRDPDKELIGVYGSGLLYGNNVGRGVWTVAGEFESYLGKFTGRAILGVQGASSYTAGLSPFEVYSYGGRSAFTTPDYFTDIVSATFYPIDDLALSVGHIYSFGRNAVTGEVEYLLPQFRGGNIAPSAFVSAAYGWNNSSNIMAGIRIYFGNHDKKKSLKPSRKTSPDLFLIERLRCSSMVDPMMVRCVEGILFSHDFRALIRKIFIQHVKAGELIGKRQGYCKIKVPTILRKL